MNQSAEKCLNGHPGPLHPKSELCERCYAKATQEWGTPQDLWLALNMEFRFHLDAAATAANAKCKAFISPEQDGLSTPWIQGKISRVFCNPGFSNAANWMEQAYRESRTHPQAV